MGVSSSNPSYRSAPRTGLLTFLLVASALLAYSNAFHGAFLYDDTELVVQNSFLRSWHFFPTLFHSHIGAGAGIADFYYRPLQMALYMAVFQTVGPSLPAFHALNISLHAMNAALVFALGRRLDFRVMPAFLASLLWAVHPLHTEIIAYISGSADPLYVFFCLAALVLCLPDLTTRKVMLITPLFIAALLTKEEAIMFPGLVACCIFLKSEKRFDMRSYLKLWPLVIAALVYIGLRLTLVPISKPSVLASASGQALASAPPLLTFFATLPAYLELMFWPAHLHLERSFPAFTSFVAPQVLLGMALASASLYQVIWRQDREAAPLSFAILWFVTAYFLHTGLPFVLKTPFMEHWMYLPTVGLFLGAFETVYPDAASVRCEMLCQRTLLGLVLAWALALGIATFQQNKNWKDGEAFYANILSNGESSARIHNNYGNILLEQQDPAGAMTEYNHAIDSSKDQDAYAHYNLAILFMQSPKDCDCIDQHLDRALALDPDFLPAVKAFADLYKKRHQPEKAAPYEARAAALEQKLKGQNQ